MTCTRKGSGVDWKNSLKLLKDLEALKGCGWMWVAKNWKRLTSTRTQKQQHQHTYIFIAYFFRLSFCNPRNLPYTSYTGHFWKHERDITWTEHLPQSQTSVTSFVENDQDYDDGDD